MHVSTIKFDRHLHCLEKNGSMKMTGMAIQESKFDEKITFMPINSKDIIGRAQIDYPIELLPQLIKKLQSIHEKNKLKEK